MGFMNIATIESELTKMSDSERRNVIEIATALIGNGRGRPSSSMNEKRKRLKDSAESAAEYYQTNKELTIWTALDGEDFFDVQR